MFKLADLFIEIGARTGGVEGALAKVHTNLLGMGPAGAKVSEILHGLTLRVQGLNWAMIGLGASIIGAFAIGGFMALMKCVRAASDLNETIQKTEQVFGSATDVVTAGADEMARKFGVVKREFLDAAAMFGGALQGAGMDESKAAEMAVMLTKRAADVASQANVDNATAMERMMAALRGEYDPAERLSVFMNEASVKAKAYAMGLAKAGQELTLQQKMMARVQLLMEQTARAEGDLDRTAGGFANQTRMLEGNMTNLSVIIGNEVMPAFAGALGELNRGLSWAIEHVEELKRAFRMLLPELALLADYFGSRPEAEQERKRRRLGIDERNEEMRKQALADQAAAMDKHKPKGFQGGLEEFVKHIQSAAFGNKDQTAKAQLEEARKLNATQDRTEKLIAAMAGKRGVAAQPGAVAWQ